jgi:hypothetical protein
VQVTRSAESVLHAPDVASAAASPLSASNEELSHLEGIGGCKRWPPRLYLLSNKGMWVPGRCGSSNLCEYCLLQELHVIRRMLTDQAVEGPVPEVVAVLGTRTATYDPAPFYDGRRLVMRALKREFGPDVQYSCLSEFTTGKSHYSGGLRRPHWNMLFHGIPVAGVDVARELVIPTWCRHVDAEPEAQYVEALRDTAAFMRYVAEHFTKTSQQPPQDGRWKHKQRFNCSRGYFAPLTRAHARERAKWRLQEEREIVKAVKRGAADPMAEAAAALEVAKSTSWSLQVKGAIEPASKPNLIVRAAVLRARRWEAEDLKRARNTRPERQEQDVQPKGGAFSGDLRACERRPKGSGRAAAGQPGQPDGERPPGPPSRPSSGQPGRFVLHFRTGKGVRDGSSDRLRDLPDLRAEASSTAGRALEAEHLGQGVPDG